MWNADDPWFVDAIFKAFDSMLNAPLVPSQIWVDEKTYNDIKVFNDEDLEL